MRWLTDFSTAKVNAGSAAISGSYGINVRDSPGLHRSLAVHANDRGSIQKPPS